MKLKKGQVRDDGMVYMGKKRGEEYWSTREVYENTIECQRLYRENRREAFNNHPRTLKRGDKRKDGMVFLEYNIGSTNFESWVTPDKLEAKRKHISKYNKSRDKKKYNAMQRTRHARMRAECPIWRMTRNVRNRIYMAFKTSTYSKNSKTAKMIGCSFEELSSKLESQFTDGMTWDNMKKGGWVIDHRIPLCAARSQDEIEKLNHYSNLQPMWDEDNTIKGGKYCMKEFEAYLEGLTHC